MRSLTRGQLGTFGKEVGNKLGWYLWNAKRDLGPIALDVPGYPHPIVVPFTPADREGKYEDYDFDINVHSMMLRDPATQYSLATRWVKEVAVPLAPIAQSQGLNFDVAKYARMTADYLHMPELAELFVAQAVAQVPQAGGPVEAGTALGGGPQLTVHNGGGQRPAPQGGASDGSQDGPASEPTSMAG